MFLKTFRKVGSAEGRETLVADMQRVLIDHPDRTDDNGSLVYERADGDLGGLVGLIPIPMKFGDRSINATAISTWMVENTTRDPGAGAALMRGHFKRRLDVTMTDTANQRSMEFRRPLHMRFGAPFSLQWVYPLCYVGYALAVAASRLHVRGAGPAVAAVGRSTRWLNSVWRGWESHRNDISTRCCTPVEFGHAWCALNKGASVHPDWSAERVAWILSVAGARKSLGPLHLRLALDEEGALAGCFAWHASDNGRGIVLTVAVRPGAEENVMRALLAEASNLGLAYMCGSAAPHILEGLFRIPGVFLRQPCATLVGSRDSTVETAFLAGQAVLGGLVGDSWTPLATEPYS